MAEVNALKRVFVYGDKKLDDPNSEWNTKQVIDFYSGTYPEIVNSNLEGPEVKGNVLEYTINTKKGTKG